jgi:glycerophosphoryl diester phosphodiesterase
MSTPAVRFLAHRGRCGGPMGDKLRENTVASVKAALRLGPDYIEVDTRNLGDGTIVLSHDPTVVLTPGQPARRLADLTKESFVAANGELFRDVSLDALFEVVEQASPDTDFVLDVKDIDGQRSEANLRQYVDSIVGRGLQRRVALISWNIWVLRGLMDLKRRRPDARPIRLGFSFVPVPLPSWMFGPLAWLANRAIHGGFDSVVFYNLAEPAKTALCQNGLFPICLERIEAVRRSLGDDTILCIRKTFAQPWFRRVIGPLIGLTRDLSEPPPALWLYTFNSVPEISALSSQLAARLAREELVLFTEILGRFDFRAEERRLSGVVSRA